MEASQKSDTPSAQSQLYTQHSMAFYRSDVSDDERGERQMSQKALPTPTKVIEATSTKETSAPTQSARDIPTKNTASLIELNKAKSILEGTAVPLGSVKAAATIEKSASPTEPFDAMSIGDIPESNPLTQPQINSTTSSPPPSSTDRIIIQREISINQYSIQLESSPTCEPSSEVSAIQTDLEGDHVDEYRLIRIYEFMKKRTGSSSDLRLKCTADSKKRLRTLSPEL